VTTDAHPVAASMLNAHELAPSKEAATVAAALGGASRGETHALLLATVERKLSPPGAPHDRVGAPGR
jgi:hypothetical protein